MTSAVQGSNFTSEFHIFALEWEPTEVRWYIDGVLNKTWSAPITNERMQLILDTTVGVKWPGSPDAATVFPAYHYVDYVRVYQRTASNP